MTWLCLVYTWYIPDIYQSNQTGKVCIWYISGIYLVYIWHISFILVYTRFMLYICLVVGAEVVGTVPYRLARPHTASVNENTMVSHTEFRHLLYDRYIPSIYHLLGPGPDPNRRGTNWNTRPEADVSIAFIGLVPCLNTNTTFKHQQH